MRRVRKSRTWTYGVRECQVRQRRARECRAAAWRVRGRRVWKSRVRTYLGRRRRVQEYQVPLYRARACPVPVHPVPIQPIPVQRVPAFQVMLDPPGYPAPPAPVLLLRSSLRPRKHREMTHMTLFSTKFPIGNRSRGQRGASRTRPRIIHQPARVSVRFRANRTLTRSG